MGLEPEVFVARSAELGTLRRHHADARHGQPRIVLIEGEPGIGKTSLVREFLTSVSAENVIRVAADEAEPNLTYGLLAQVVAALPSASLSRCPALRSGPSPGSDPLLVGTELAAVLGKLGVTLVIEDLHWADLPSSEALLFAAQRLRDQSVLLVVTYRGTELGRLATRWERFAATDERSARISLEPFSASDVSELARALNGIRLARPAASRLVDHTAGSPLYVRALLDELPTEVLVTDGGPLPAPRSLSGVINDRLSRLPPPARELVIATAVLGHSARLQAAGTLAGLEDPTTALDAAHGAGLLHEVSGTAGRDVAFTHPLVRAAIYDGISPSRRQALHQSAAAFLTDLPAILAHRVAAAIGPDAKLADDLESAGRSDAARRDLTAAAAHYQQASRLSETRTARERRLIGSVGFLLHAGDVAAAAAYRADLESCEVSTARDYVLGQLAFLGGRPLDGEQLLRNAWRLRASGDIDAALAAALLLGESIVLSRPANQAVALLQAAVDLCPAEHPLKSLLAAELYGAFGVDGRGGDGLRMLSTHMPADAGDCAPEQLDAVVLRALTRCWCHDLDGALADLQTAIRRAHEGLSGHRYTQAVSYLSEVEFRLGRLDESIGHGEQAVRDAYDAERVWAYPFIHSQVALPYAARGDWASADLHVRAAQGMARAYGVIAAVAYAANAAAFVAWTRGDALGVLRAVDDLDGREGGGIGEPGVLGYEVPLVDALIELGQLGRAADCLSSLEAKAGDRKLLSVMLDCHRLRASLAAAQGRLEHAECAFSRGHEIASNVNVPLTRGLFHLAHGRHLRMQRQRRAAVNELRVARDLFDELGAMPFVTRTDDELRSCAISRRGRAMTRMSLSSHERAVARLVLQGRTNREIADALTVSPKTVEYHLARMYTKLEVSNRTELAGDLARRTFEDLR